MWQRENLIKWLPSAILTVALFITGIMWNSYREKNIMKDAKIETQQTQNAELRLSNVKYEMELLNVNNEREDLKERVKNLEREKRWRNR